jgi:hypothetical protein
MSRTIPNAILTALAQPEVQPFYAVEFLFDTSPVRCGRGMATARLMARLILALAAC